MAFAASGIDRLAIAIDGLDWWDYRTTDSTATVEGVGYFNPFAAQLRPNDKILVTSSDNILVYYVASLTTPVNIQGVTQSTSANSVTVARMNVAAAIAAGSITNAMLANMAALTVKANPTNSSAAPQDIAAVAASGAVLRESGSLLSFGTVATAGIANDAVDNTKLRNSGALSVIGRSVNSSGDPADISATATSDQPLVESGSVLAFTNLKSKVVIGTTTNDNASAGFLGEYSSGTQGTPQALTNNTALSIVSVTLGAGDWDLRTVGVFSGGATTTVQYLIVSIGSTANTLTAANTEGNHWIAFADATLFNSLASVVLNGGPARFSLSGSTTVNLTVQAGFAVSTCSCAGFIAARRAR